MQQNRPRLSNRQQIALAVLGSVLINIGLACAVAFAAQLWPPATPDDDPGPMKVSFTSEPEPEPEPESHLVDVSKPTPPPYQETLERQRSDRPPDEADAESDKDTQRASELEAKNNDRSAPTQDGRAGPVLAFDTREYTPGEKAIENTPQSAPPPPEPPAPTPPPVVDPPRPQVNRAAVRPSPTPPPPVAALPTPAPAPTPLPGRAEAQEFAMLAPTPTPPPAPSPTPDEPLDARLNMNPPPPTPRPSYPPLQLARQRPQAPQPIVKLPDTPGYQSQTVRSRIEGGISNRGASSIAARDTPMGRYHKALGDAIGSRWYFGIQQHADTVQIGTVRIIFAVDAHGKVHQPRIVEGNSNGALASVSLAAVLEANLPPIPPDLAAALPGGNLEVTYSFTSF